MNIARLAHTALNLDGEITVIGGHTDGFIPTPTAEYYSGGQWNTVSSKYTHDNAFVVTLPDGQVMVGGGSAEAFGIGQSWGVELYNPKSHSFAPIGIMDRKRARSSALALPDGRVIVSGNWYAEDAVETFTPGEGFAFTQDVSEGRCLPYILKSGPDRIIIFGGEGTHGEVLEGIVDRIGEEPYRDSTLSQWRVSGNSSAQSGKEYEIGEYTYLIPAQRKSDGMPGILKLSGERFSVLETDTPLPVKTESGDSLNYFHRLIVDRPLRRAWMFAADGKSNVVAVRIDYDATFEGGKATATLFSSKLPGDNLCPDNRVLMLPGGRFLFTGGSYTTEDCPQVWNNFTPSGTAYILFTETPQKTSGIDVWAIVAVILMMGLAAVLYALIRKNDNPVEPAPEEPREKEDLLSRINRLMENEELYRVKGLSKNDIAERLGTNVTYISACINAQLGQSFTDYVADFRVRCAKDIMKKNPGKRLAEVADESGFSSEQTFFRTFKAKTGVTPQEWRNA